MGRPKSILTIALLPVIMDKLFDLKPLEQEASLGKPKDINFEGRQREIFAPLVKKIMNNNKFQDFVIKNQEKDKNIAKHLTAGTDVLLTSTYAVTTKNSKKIKEDRKNPLIYNSLTSTGLTLTFGYAVDKLISKDFSKFIEKFSKINAGDKNLAKYIEGLNIVRPAIIFAGIYYGILPMISTYVAERIDKKFSSSHHISF